MIRFAFAVSQFGGGGAEKHVVDLANGLVSRGYACQILIFRDYPRCDHALDPRVEPHDLLKRFGNDPRIPWRIKKMLRESGIQVLHSINWSTFLESSIAARLAGGVVHVHGQRGMERNWARKKSGWKETARGIVRRWGARRAAAFVAVSDEIRDWLIEGWGADPRRVTVIPNGIAPAPPANPSERERIRHALGLKPEEIAIGTVGRLEPVKQQRLLVEAFGRVAREVPAARLLFVGEGTQRNALEERCRGLGIRDRVEFLGRREDARALLGGFDLFVLPSLSEGSPQSLLEAMGGGLASVATRVGGSAESIDDGKTGLLVDPQDPADLAARLVELSRSPEDRRRLGENAARAVRENWSFDAMVGRYDELYRSLLGLPQP